MTDATAPTPMFDDSVVERTAYEKEAIWLPAFAVSHMKAGKTLIDGKTFTDCVIEGPAVLFAADNVNFDGCSMGVTDDAKNLLLQTVGSKVTGVVPFANTRFVRCRFVAIGYTGHPDFLKQIADNLKITSEGA